MKLEKIKLSLEESAQIVSYILKQDASIHNVIFQPHFVNNRLDCFYVTYIDLLGRLKTQVMDLNEYFRYIKIFYNLRNGEVSHIVNESNKDECYFNCYLYPLDYKKQVLKKRRDPNGIC